MRKVLSPSDIPEVKDFITYRSPSEKELIIYIYSYFDTSPLNLTALIPTKDGFILIVDDLFE